MNKVLAQQQKLVRVLLHKNVPSDEIDIVVQALEIAYMEGRIEELRNEHSYAEDLHEREVDAYDKGVPTLNDTITNEN